MARKKLTVAFTKAEQKDLDSAVTLYIRSENARDEIDEYEDKMNEAQEQADEILDEAENLVSDLNDQVNARLRKEAEAEAVKLNKANKDPKVEYVVRYKGDAEIDVGENDALTVEVFEVVKQKKHDSTSGAVSLLKALGYKVTK